MLAHRLLTTEPIFEHSHWSYKKNMFYMKQGNEETAYQPAMPHINLRTLYSVCNIFGKHTR